jgi:enediyne biosynthesis protein E4
MSRGVRQGILAVLFIGLLGFIALRGGFLEGVWNYFSGTRSDAATSLPPEEALRRYGFYLREVSKQSGIDFVHKLPTFDAQLEHIMPIIASMGAGVSIMDFDHDGLLDIYVVNSGEGSKNRLYRNKGDGTFEDVAEKVGLADLNQPGTGVCMGAVWGDFDNDGFEDVLIYKWGRPELYRNNGGKSFTRVTEKAGLPKWVNANNAIWLDYDRDGKLDLLICGYWRDDIDLWNLQTTQIMPESFEYATNGGRKYLLRNKGDGTFEDVTEKVGIKSTRWTLAAAAANLSGSGYPDLVLANDYGVSEVFANRDGKRFEEVGRLTGIGETPKSGMNVSFGDIFNQGRLAIYISNITEPVNLVQGNNLWVPQGKTTTGLPRYLNQAGTLNVERGGWSWGAQFGDLNNDGLLDLYLTNGYISADPGRSYWYDYSLISSASFKNIILDAKNWPSMKGQSLSGFQTKCVWLNKRGDFSDVAQRVGVTDKFDGRSVALADLGNRGVLDVVVANQKGPLLLYQNTVAPERNWVQFDLEGTKSNRSAIGAEVHLFWTQGGTDHQQLQLVSGGSGYASQNMRRLHFGLGKDAVIQKAVIHWPSGTVQTVENLKVDRLHPIKEPSP